MVEHSIQRERERALRLENTVRRAVKIATRYQNEYEVMKDENAALKKENAELKRKERSLTNAVSNLDNDENVKVIIATLSKETQTVLRTVLRKSLHPDKHVVSDDVKKPLGSIFNIIEGYFK